MLSPAQIKAEFYAHEKESGATQLTYRDQQKTLSSTEELLKMLRVGFDEIFLLHLFRNLACASTGNVIQFDSNGFLNSLSSAYLDDVDPMYENFFEAMFLTPRLNAMKVPKRIITTSTELNALQLTDRIWIYMLDQFLEGQTDIVRKQFILDASLVSVTSNEIVPINVALLNYAYYTVSELLDPIYDIFHALV